MLNSILGMIGLGGPDYDARILARDAGNLIDMFHGQHGDESLTKIADQARLHIADVHRRGLNDPQFYGQGVKILTELNKAARSRRDNISWSGITLAIVYIKSEMLGEIGKPAINRIEGFMDRRATMTAEEAVEKSKETPPPMPNPPDRF